MTLWLTWTVPHYRLQTNSVTLRIPAEPLLPFGVSPWRCPPSSSRLMFLKESSLFIISRHHPFAWPSLTLLLRARETGKAMRQWEVQRSIVAAADNLVSAFQHRRAQLHLMLKSKPRTTTSSSRKPLPDPKMKQTRRKYSQNPDNPPHVIWQPYEEAKACSSGIQHLSIDHETDILKMISQSVSAASFQIGYRLQILFRISEPLYLIFQSFGRSAMMLNNDYKFILRIVVSHRM